MNGTWPKLIAITKHSTLKTPDSAPCIRMGNLKWGRIHIPCSGLPSFKYYMQIGVYFVTMWGAPRFVHNTIRTFDVSYTNHNNCNVSYTSFVWHGI